MTKFDKLYDSFFTENVKDYPKLPAKFNVKTKYDKGTFVESDVPKGTTFKNIDKRYSLSFPKPTDGSLYTYTYSKRDLYPLAHINMYMKDEFEIELVGEAGSPFGDITLMKLWNKKHFSLPKSDITSEKDIIKYVEDYLNLIFPDFEKYYNDRIKDSKRQMDKYGSN
jgi:hypothetical protein